MPKFRDGDETGPDYICSKCKCFGYRLWRETHTMLNNIELLCASCAEIQEASAIKEYAKWHVPSNPCIGNLVPARPTPEGDTFWGHCAGDTEWWYALPQYEDITKELVRVRIERNHFLKLHNGSSDDWLKFRKALLQIRSSLREAGF